MVEVLFFAELQEAVGSEKLSFEGEGLTVTEFKNVHLEKYNFKTLDQAMVAINEEYASENTVLKSGDVLAFIPPVSGG